MIVYTEFLMEPKIVWDQEGVRICVPEDPQWRKVEWTWDRKVEFYPWFCLLFSLDSIFRFPKRVRRFILSVKI